MSAADYRSKQEPEPKLDWQIGDPPERWPHGYVQWGELVGVCGTVINNDTMQRCCGAPEWRVHRVGGELERRLASVKGNKDSG